MTIDEFVDLAKRFAKKGSSPDWEEWNAAMQKFVVDNLDAARMMGDEDDHLWFDGVTLFVNFNLRMPSAAELAEDMFDEWDDPVSEDDARHFLEHLRLVSSRTVTS